MERQVEKRKVAAPRRVPQDLHIHTVFSKSDAAIVPEQTLELIATIRHAEVIGISDHLDCMDKKELDAYVQAVPSYGFHLGMEISGGNWVNAALSLPVEYYVYHCEDKVDDYRGAERLLETGRPVIIAHPQMLSTDLNKVPPDCLIEINNRYVWRNNWRNSYGPYLDRFRFVIDSDAHQPHWLNQNAARFVALQLGIEETLLFPSC